MEDIKILESFIQTNIDFLQVNKREIQAIENLIARYKELEREKEKYKKLANENLRNEIIFREKEQPEDVYIKQEMYIPKSKIQEKIDSKFKEAKGLYERGVQPQAQFTIKLLRDLEKELLED